MPTAVETPVDFVQLSREYSGRWVAIDPATGEVLASGASAIEVYAKATQAGVEEPFITHVVDNYGDYVTCLS